MTDSFRLAGYPSVMTTPGRRTAGGRTRVGARPVAAASGKRLAPVVYEALKERLLEGTYQAGERLSVETLKTEFEVSKQPVMEALHRLAADGLVEIVPQVGCRVVRYEPQEVTDFYAIFGAMEGAVAGSPLFGAPRISWPTWNMSIGRSAISPTTLTWLHVPTDTESSIGSSTPQCTPWRIPMS